MQVSHRVSPIRLGLMTELLLEESGTQAFEKALEAISPLERDTVHQIRSRVWLDAKQEVSILQYLCERFAAYRFLNSAGRSAFSLIRAKMQIALPEGVPGREALQLFPAMVQCLGNHRFLRMKEQGSQIFFEIVYPDGNPDATGSLDLLFFQGFLQGFLDDMKWREISMSPRATTALRECWPDRAPYNVELEWNQACQLYEIRGAALEQLLPAGKAPPEIITEYNAAQIESVLDKSAQLLKDKRELITAVEYLNMANSELEKKIRVSKKELNMARNIQKGFVPNRIPDWKGLQFWVKFYPMTEVSGDFYDYFTLGGNKLGFLVCDVSGHGVPAALITAIAKLSFNNHRLDSPAEVFNRVNLDLMNYVKQEGYLTGFYMIIDSENQIVFSRAAAPTALLLRARNGVVEKMQGRGTLLGMFPDANRHFEDVRIKLEPGDKIFVYTDGITEANNPNGDMFGEDRLIDAVKETSGMDVQQASEHVMQVHERFTLGTDSGDDLTMITIMLSERQDEFNELISKARSLYHQNLYPEACITLEEAIQIFPRHTTTLFLLSRYLVKDKRYQEAMQYLKQYNSLRAYNADAYTLLARCAYELKIYPMALENLKRSLSLRVDNPRAYYYMGLVYAARDDRKEAMEALQSLRQLRPNDPRTLDLAKLLE